MKIISNPAKVVVEDAKVLDGSGGTLQLIFWDGQEAAGCARQTQS